MRMRGDATTPEGDPGALAAVGAVSIPDRRALADRIAAIVVRAGGVGIIASILAILVFIVAEVWPLLGGARVVVDAKLSVDPPAQALLVDPYRSIVVSVDGDGHVRARSLESGSVVDERKVIDVSMSSLVAGLADPEGRFLALLDGSGSIAVVPIAWQVSFDQGQRKIAVEIGDPSSYQLPEDRLVMPFVARTTEDGSEVLAAHTATGQIALFRRSREVNDFTGETKESESRSFAAAPANLQHLVLDDEQESLFGSAAGGRIYRWDARPSLAPPIEVAQVDGDITALTLLLGGRALVVGLESGGLQVWFPTVAAEGHESLSLIRKFPPHASAIRHLTSSRRDKGFVAVDAADNVGLYYSTSERVLWRGPAQVEAVRAVVMSPKGDGIAMSGSQSISVLEVDNPHPDVSLWSLFAPVWYEGYSQPEYVWQSTGGTDDFEPKYSLTPLLIGTLKGTFYSLLIAIPLGVLGAMYVSQFMHPRLRNVIKPTVELMAALPSVVLGFLAGLWLAPRIEEVFSALLLMIVAFPVVIIVSGSLWERLPVRWRNRMPVGSEALVFAVTLALAGAGCLALNDAFEAAVFGGSFQTWLRSVVGLQYDQRNAIVVGLAMGFAVIPIIFAISEDAFSNVPRTLVSGSLALGANRWQTVSRIVLPTASPGIFSAIMVGFGRAVGETMIVLMATGNTPIRDWSPFNGFRTLSANIAVEIPEAPQFGTLYRVLFLAALLLFAVTFALNTLAELVRQRLRARYARL